MAKNSNQNVLAQRFGNTPEIEGIAPNPALNTMLARGSCRSFEDRDVPPAVLDILCAAALASPTKSDLQQRDIIRVRSEKSRKTLASLVAGQAWVASAPLILVFCGNNRRQRMLHDKHNIPFENDHLDAFFNATVDAAIALSAFVTATEALGLGCCSISAMRNEARAVSDLLGLPQHVFPVAGLALGYPAESPEISKRLPVSVTVHTDQYRETGLTDAIQTYDAERAATQPYAMQRLETQFGTADPYTWSIDKARQYSQPERETFADYIRAQGFNLT
jgi:nitroreductase/FMN reductase [NAD(P)H]